MKLAIVTSSQPDTCLGDARAAHRFSVGFRVWVVVEVPIRDTVRVNNSTGDRE